ncbi:pyrrolo-quinoline quinone [Anaerobacillus sp. CMMVII]|uniref:hypothetical protein n=1 Tax=Anaerobacillus sp. CMMVII TaxID=2755588 RepID=UPI0021B7CE48|nr:hypothetical protein [Anaerobacillus sp. CMMVII]MCT8138266.1 pyrrolo-quinoline quinone [Anaerobacillus sp. CMMVII]
MKKRDILMFGLCFAFVASGCNSISTTNDSTNVKTIERTRPQIEKARNYSIFNHDFQKIFDVEPGDLSLINYEIQSQGKSVETYHSEGVASFPDLYTEVEGILTFRGSHLRDRPAYGLIYSGQSFKLEERWSFQTGASPRWGGGSGWTGQPSIVKWSNEVREMMDIKESFKRNDDFVEIIYGSLDGNIYFLDLNTGEKTRTPITIGNPIKGSVSVDSRGYPLLYVGDGINQKAPFGQRIFDLINRTELYFLKGEDPFAYRNWGAFDSSPLINRLTDTLVGAGENGIFYQTKLNTNFDLANQTISVNPEPVKYRYKIKGNNHQGIENSVAVYGNLAFFADNGGSIQGIDLTTMSPFFALGPLDDTDSTIGIDSSNGTPYLYTGTEVDIIGKDGDAHIRKINALTGEVVWDVKYPAFYYDGVNGGVLASPVIGKKNIDELVIYTLARYKQRYSGLMVALHKETGEEIWRWEMPHYAWSSPVDVYDEHGNAFVVQCDSIGNMYF